jgi:ABC-type polysaccharide/polyol phosphate export permease
MAQATDQTENSIIHQPAAKFSQPVERVNIQNTYSHWINLVLLLIKRDLKVRYRGSFLGYVWSMLNPLFMMAILSFVFSHAMRVKMEFYPIYILSGILVWNFFAQSANNGVRAFIDNASLLKKVRIPSWVFPTAIIGSASVHMAFALVPYLVIAQVIGFQFSWGMVQLPAILLLFFIFTEGVVLVISSLNVFFRDLGHVLEPLLQLVFYGTPIIYPISVIPENFRFIIELNPMTHFMEGFRSSLYISPFLGWSDWLLLAGVAGGALGMGLFIYHKSRDRFLYYI